LSVGSGSHLREIDRNLPIDCELHSGHCERNGAIGRLLTLSRNDVVVRDRGHRSRTVLPAHLSRGRDAVFRLGSNTNARVIAFNGNDEDDRVVDIVPSSKKALKALRRQHPDVPFGPLTMSLHGYHAGGTAFVIGNHPPRRESLLHRRYRRTLSSAAAGGGLPQVVETAHAARAFLRRCRERRATETPCQLQPERDDPHRDQSPRTRQGPRRTGTPACRFRECRRRHLPRSRNAGGVLVRCPDRGRVAKPVGHQPPSSGEVQQQPDTQIPQAGRQMGRQPTGPDQGQPNALDTTAGPAVHRQVRQGQHPNSTWSMPLGCKYAAGAVAETSLGSHDRH